MARGWALALTLAALALPAACGRDHQQPTPVDTSSVAAGYQFLYATLDRDGTGSTPRLPQSYVGGALEQDGYVSSTTYDDALVIDALLARGTDEDVSRARVVGDALRIAQQRDPAADGRLRASYDPGPVPAQGPVHATNRTSDVGAMAWAGRAMLHLYDRTHDQSYLDSAKQLAAWVQNNAYDTRGRGGYTGGLDADSTPLRWKATEHNLDLTSFFTALSAAIGEGVWNDRARHARDLATSMYDDQEHNFATGTGEDGVTVNPAFIPADAQTWSYLVLRDAHYAGSLDYAATAMAAQDRDYHGISATADERGTVWFEGTAHLALALLTRANGDDPNRAKTYLDTLTLAQHSAGPNDGRGIPAASRDAPPNGQGVRLYESLHTGATAWYVMAAQKHNPF
jgi:hypothetical protein